MLNQLLTIFTVKQLNRLIGLLSILLILGILCFPAAIAEIVKTILIYAGTAATVIYANNK